MAAFFITLIWVITVAGFVGIVAAFSALGRQQ